MDKMPIPQGKYVPATRCEGIVFTAGMTPRRSGVLILSGKVSDMHPINFYKEAVEQAAENALVAARNTLDNDEEIRQILTMTVFVNSESNFTEQSKIADLASSYLFERLDARGIGARVAVGVASLPSNAPVEIQLTVAVG